MCRENSASSKRYRRANGDDNPFDYFHLHTRIAIAVGILLQPLSTLTTLVWHEWRLVPRDSALDLTPLDLYSTSESNRRSLVNCATPALVVCRSFTRFHGRFTNRRRWIPTEIGIRLFPGANITPALFFLLLDRVTIQHRRGARRFRTRKRTAWPLPQLNVEFDLLPDATIENGDSPSSVREIVSCVDCGA